MSKSKTTTKKKAPKTFTLEVTPDMLAAIRCGISELSNSGDWCNYYRDHETNMVLNGIDELTEALKTI